MNRFKAFLKALVMMLVSVAVVALFIEGSFWAITYVMGDDSIAVHLVFTLCLLLGLAWFISRDFVDSGSE